MLNVVPHDLGGGFQIALFKLIVAGQLYKPFVGQLPGNIVPLCYNSDNTKKPSNRAGLRVVVILFPPCGGSFRGRNHSPKCADVTLTTTLFAPPLPVKGTENTEKTASKNGVKGAITLAVANLK
ncbi:MAG: hypothetical protein LBK41_02300 [Clostridiales bacterium]|nr:hypothetical protein [Clostridiales bacterium]